MAFLTDRKRAAGLGSAKEGTNHHIQMMISAVALVILMPLFLITFGSALGGSHEEIMAYYARPFPAIVAVLTLTVGLLHFNSGVRSAIEDYSGGLLRKGLVLLSTMISYGAVATGLFAIAKIAL